MTEVQTPKTKNYSYSLGSPGNQVTSTHPSPTPCVRLVSTGHHLSWNNSEKVERTPPPRFIWTAKHGLRGKRNITSLSSHPSTKILKGKWYVQNFPLKTETKEIIFRPPLARSLGNTSTKKGRYC